MGVRPAWEAMSEVGSHTRTYSPLQEPGPSAVMLLSGVQNFPFLARSQASSGTGIGVLLPSWGHLCSWAPPAYYFVSLPPARQSLKPMSRGGAIASLGLAPCTPPATLAPSLTRHHAVVHFQQALLNFLWCFLSPAATGQQMTCPGRVVLECVFPGALLGTTSYRLTYSHTHR